MWRGEEDGEEETGGGEGVEVMTEGVPEAVT